MNFAKEGANGNGNKADGKSAQETNGAPVYVDAATLTFKKQGAELKQASIDAFNTISAMPIGKAVEVTAKTKPYFQAAIKRFKSDAIEKGTPIEGDFTISTVEGGKIYVVRTATINNRAKSRGTKAEREAARIAAEKAALLLVEGNKNSENQEVAPVGEGSDVVAETTA